MKDTVTILQVEIHHKRGARQETTRWQIALPSDREESAIIERNLKEQRQCLTKGDCIFKSLNHIRARLQCAVCFKKSLQMCLFMQ